MTLWKLITRCAIIGAFLAMSVGGVSAAAQMNVSVSGNQILVNGTPGTLNGFTFVGQLNPTSCASAFYKNASAHWSSAELAVAQNQYSANTVRLQVALDLLYEPPTQTFDPAYIQTYIGQVANAVALARSMGMAVIVSMQWESGASGNNVCDENGNHGAAISGVPSNDGAANAWQALLTSTAWTQHPNAGGGTENFNHDSGVLLEILNEPTLGTLAGQPSDWQVWRSGLQPLVTAIRSYGSQNVLVIPGLNGEKILDATAVGGQSVASYLLNDDLNELVYAVHPYPVVGSSGSIHIGEFSSQDWNNYFGNVAKTISAPVVVTEWFTGGIGNDCWDPSRQPSPTPYGYTAPTDFYTPTIASQFLSWLQSAGPNGSAISMPGAWPFDASQYFEQRLSGTWPPTFFDDNFACGVAVQGAYGGTYEGPGQLIQKYFASFPPINLQLATTSVAYPNSTNITVSVGNTRTATPTGNVSIYDGETLLDTLPLQGNGEAYWYIEPSLTTGLHHIAARYSGDGTYASTSSPLTVLTIRPAQVNLSASCWNPSFAYGGSYACTANVSSDAGSAAGVIDYAVDGRAQSINLTNGSAQFSVVTPTVGSHDVLINYTGQGNFAAAVPINNSFIVTPASTQIQLTPSGYYQAVATPLTLTASLTSSTAGAPSDGTILFYDGTKLLGSGAANANVSFIVSGLAPGKHSFVASYVPGPSGDYAAVTSPAVSVQLY